MKFFAKEPEGVAPGIVKRVMVSALRDQETDLDDIEAVAHTLARAGFTAAEVTELAREAVEMARSS